MDKALKTLGLFPVKINLHAEVQVEVIVNIARSAEEAKTQTETGSAIVANNFDEEEAVAETAAPLAEEKPESAEAEADTAEADAAEADADEEAKS